MDRASLTDDTSIATHLRFPLFQTATWNRPERGRRPYIQDVRGFRSSVPAKVLGMGARVRQMGSRKLRMFPPISSQATPAGLNAPARVVSWPLNRAAHNVTATKCREWRRTGVLRACHNGPRSARWYAAFCPLAPLHQAWSKAGR